MKRILLGTVLAAAIVGWLMAFATMHFAASGSMQPNADASQLAQQIAASEVRLIDLKGDRWFVAGFTDGRRELYRSSGGAHHIVAELTGMGVDLGRIEVRDSTKQTEPHR